MLGASLLMQINCPKVSVQLRLRRQKEKAARVSGLKSDVLNAR
jgi:hypothetical protein